LSGKSERKRELIIKKAKEVFVKKGFSGVTMKDIIEECKISRGGIYLYFSSVDEIFIEVVNRHNQAKAEEIKADIKESGSFEVMLDRYFAMQKNRLLHLENSLLLAMFEFYIANKHEPDKDFFSGSFEILESSVYEILSYGAKTGCLEANGVRALAANIIYSIKGLETQSISFGITEELLDTQFNFYKNMILKKGSQSDE
jgi:AcrR family transcriptional regulator